MKSKRKKRERGETPDLRERLCEALDMVPDTLPRTATVEIRGQNYVSIREGGRILFYSPEKISVALPQGSVSILGRRLVCTSYTPDTVRVDGFVCSVCFEEDTDA